MPKHPTVQVPNIGSMDHAWDLLGEWQTERVLPDHGRDGDDLYMLYTGGTTGMPKGVMWRNDDLLLVLNDGAPRARKLPEDVDLDHLRQVVSSPGIRTLPACPLMHGTGAFNAFLAPVIFNDVWEYPIVLALSCLARPWGRLIPGVAP